MQMLYINYLKNNFYSISVKFYDLSLFFSQANQI